VRAIREKDVATLQGAPRVGRKKAEQLILDLAEKMDDLLPAMGNRARGMGAGPVPEDAVRALVSLGYANQDAERAVKAAIDSGGKGMSVPDLIREALKKVTDARR
jgi:Holliday junction DNA helicase RuvA